MYKDIEGLECDEINEASEDMTEVFPIILGKQKESVSLDNMFRAVSLSDFT